MMGLASKERIMPYAIATLGIIMAVMAMLFVVYYANATNTANQSQNEVATLQTQNTNLQNQLTNDNSQISSLNAQISSLNAQISSLNGQINTLSTEKQELQQQVNSLSETVNALMGQLTQGGSGGAAGSRFPYMN
jgi:septal ring factor EnvC (AmiA/AmiB activator)